MWTHDLRSLLFQWHGRFTAGPPMRSRGRDGRERKSGGRESYCSSLCIQWLTQASTGHKKSPFWPLLIYIHLWPVPSINFAVAFSFWSRFKALVLRFAIHETSLNDNNAKGKCTFRQVRKAGLRARCDMWWALLREHPAPVRVRGETLAVSADMAA